MHALVMAMYGNARLSSKIKQKFPLVSQPLFKSNYKAGGGRGGIPSARTPTQDTELQRSWQSRAGPNLPREYTNKVIKLLMF